MNLLNSKWISVRQGSDMQMIDLEELLCSQQSYELALPRDDMELGALQLLISLVQVIAMPDSRAALRERLAVPLSREEYRSLTAPWLDYFDIGHAKQPFMQVVDPKAKEETPIQKLFVGLPSGNNHAFFNDPGEINQVCGGCAAIAVFNQASNAPGFSGKHKAGLRGGGKVNTFAQGASLRETIWLNVLHKGAVENLLPEATEDQFCWVSPISPGSKIASFSIGLRRGLFWQPLRMKLVSKAVETDCEHCGHLASSMYTGFLCEADFKFEVVGQWLHPHSPRQWDIKNGSIERERYLAFNQTVPAWTQLNHYLAQKISDSEGYCLAEVIRQFEDVFAQDHRLHLIIASYSNKQAAILERRHELFSLPSDLGQTKPRLDRAVSAALEIKTALRGRLYYFGKKTGAQIHIQSERIFYQRTESLIHKLLREFESRKDAKAALEQFLDASKKLARDIFELLSQPYQHSPSGLKHYSEIKRSLNAALKQITV